MLCSGTSTVKYSIPLYCIGLSERDSKIYINFEFCERKNHKIFEKHIDLQSQAIYVENFYFKKNLHIFEDVASSVQVDTLNM